MYTGKHVSCAVDKYKIISGYLRHCVRDNDMAAHPVRRVCGLWANLAAQLQQLYLLQYSKYGYIPSTCIPGIRIASAHNALGSGKSVVNSLCCTCFNSSHRIQSRVQCRVAMPPRK